MGQPNGGNPASPRDLERCSDTSRESAKDTTPKAPGSASKLKASGSLLTAVRKNLSFTRGSARKTDTESMAAAANDVASAIDSAMDTCQAIVAALQEPPKRLAPGGMRTSPDNINTGAFSSNMAHLMNLLQPLQARMASLVVMGAEGSFVSREDLPPPLIPAAGNLRAAIDSALEGIRNFRLMSPLQSVVCAEPTAASLRRQCATIAAALSGMADCLSEGNDGWSEAVREFCFDLRDDPLSVSEIAHETSVLLEKAVAADDQALPGAKPDARRTPRSGNLFQPTAEQEPLLPPQALDCCHQLIQLWTWKGVIGSDWGPVELQREMFCLWCTLERMSTAQDAKAIQLAIYGLAMLALTTHEDTGRNGNPPTYYICPLSDTLLKDPVIIESGQVFERKNIQEYFKARGVQCPVSRQPLQGAGLAPHEPLRREVAAWAVNNREWAKAPPRSGPPSRTGSNISAPGNEMVVGRSPRAPRPDSAADQSMRELLLAVHEAYGRGQSRVSVFNCCFRAAAEPNVEASLFSLQKASQDSQVARALLEKEAVTTLGEVLQWGKRDCQLCALEILLNLVQHDTSRDKRGTMAALLPGLAQSLTGAGSKAYHPCHEAAVKLLGQLSRDNPHACSAVANTPKLITQLVKVLDSSSPEAQALATQVVVDLAATEADMCAKEGRGANKGVRAQMVAANAIRKLCMLMAGQNLDLAEVATGAVGPLAQLPNVGEQFGQFGAIAAIVELVQSPERSRRLAGLQSLAVLVDFPDNWDDIEKYGGVANVIKTGRCINAKDSAREAAACAHVLAEISKDPELAKDIATVEGVGALTQMLATSDDVRTQADASAALGCLAERDGVRTEIAYDSPAVPLMLAVLSNQPLPSDIKQTIVDALMKIAGDEAAALAQHHSSSLTPAQEQRLVSLCSGGGSGTGTMTTTASSSSPPSGGSTVPHIADGVVEEEEDDDNDQAWGLFPSASKENSQAAFGVASNYFAAAQQAAVAHANMYRPTPPSATVFKSMRPPLTQTSSSL